MILNKSLPEQEPAKTPRAEIRILATTDLHMNLTGFDYYADRPDPSIGFTRTATLIRRARTQAGDSLVLLFDNGDSLQGTPLGEWAATHEGPHPLMQAFGALDYDAIALGNHDFGFGLPVLDHVLAQASCPVVCSNMRPLKAPQIWADGTILERTVLWQEKPAAIRIGVLSVLPPQTARWESHLLQDEVIAEDILEAAHKQVKHLRSEGCDLILALSHSGLGEPQPAPGLENAAIPLAAIDGIDAIIAGHTHLTLPGPAHEGFAHVDPVAGRIHGKPAVMPGSAGSYLGVIDLSLSRDPSGKWRIEDSRAELRPVVSEPHQKPVPEDPQFVELFAQAHARTRAMVAEPVARIPRVLHSYFSLCAPDPGLALAAAAQAAALRPHLSASGLADLPVLSAVAPCKSGGRAGPRWYTEVPAGELCLRHIADLHLFPNELRGVVVTGAQVRDWLEMSASVFNQQSPGQTADLIDPRRVGYNFDVLFGLNYRFDLSQAARFDAEGALTDPAHNRVSRLEFADQPVQPDQRFVVALNHYRASGGGNFPTVFQSRIPDLPTLEIKQVLKDYLSGILPRDPLEDAPHPFCFAPLAGACAVLRTGPGAIKYLDELDIFTPQQLGRDAEGFERIGLTL